MKNFILSFIFLMTTVLSFGQTTTDKVLTGVGTEVSALHADSKDAISTLHQDAQAIISTAYTDGKGLLSTVYDDVNKILKYATPKLEAGLIALAQTLKTTVAEVYRVLIMKQIAISISYLFMGLFALFLAYVSYRIINLPDEKLLKSRADSYGEIKWKPQWSITLVATICSSLALFVAFFVNFQTMCIGFIAPQAGAIKEIVSLVDTLLR